MKTIKITFLSALLFLSALCIGLLSCSSDEGGEDSGDTGGNTGEIVEYLQKYKWEATDADWLLGDEWINGDIYYVTIYFLSDKYGVIRLANRSYDSDDGVSLDVESYVFTYSVSGTTIRIELENGERWDPLTFSIDRLVQGGTVFEAKKMNSDDYSWINEHGPKTGKCGDNVSWAYTELSNTLTISGEGEMYDYNAGKQPWSDLNFYYVVIEEGVTSVGANAFNNFVNVTEVELPGTLTKIGDLSFQGTLLRDVYISGNVKEIGYGAFAGCNYLKKLSLYSDGSKLEKIGDDAFMGCPLQFYNLELPSNLISVGNRAFMDATFTRLTLNDKLETIGDACFLGVKGDLIIPNSVKNIGSMSFGGSFDKVVIGTGVEKLGRYAFDSTARSGKMYVNLGVPPRADGNIIGNNGSVSGLGGESNWTLYVPVGAKKAYSNITPWDEFKSIVEDASLDSGGVESGDGDASDDDSEDMSYTGTVQGHDYVDLGLSVKWATCNVGADSPSEYGGLYGWGDATGNKVSVDLDDYPNANPPANISGTQYDIAYNKWGNKWRIPTSDELRELKSECSWQEKTLNGINGLECIGPNGNSIFFPFGGIREGSNIMNKGDSGDYWSANSNENGMKPEFSIQYATHLMLSSSSHIIVNVSCKRYMGLSIRPVTE